MRRSSAGRACPPTGSAGSDGGCEAAPAGLVRRFGTRSLMSSTRPVVQPGAAGLARHQLAPHRLAAGNRLDAVAARDGAQHRQAPTSGRVRGVSRGCGRRGDRSLTSMRNSPASRARRTVNSVFACSSAFVVSSETTPSAAHSNSPDSQDARASRTCRRAAVGLAGPGQSSSSRRARPHRRSDSADPNALCRSPSARIRSRRARRSPLRLEPRMAPRRDVMAAA
jgi:hypothetical protein